MVRASKCFRQKRAIARVSLSPQGAHIVVRRRGRPQCAPAANALLIGVRSLADTAGATRTRWSAFRVRVPEALTRPPDRSSLAAGPAACPLRRRLTAAGL